MTSAQTRQAALAAAALSVLGSAIYFGLAGPSAGKATYAAGLVAALAATAALVLVERLAQKRSLRIAEPARRTIETGLGGMIFLFVLYHLSHVLPFAGPVAVAIDTLVPGPVLHIFALVPGILAAVLTEAVWRRPLKEDRR